MYASSWLPCLIQPSGFNYFHPNYFLSWAFYLPSTYPFLISILLGTFLIFPQYQQVLCTQPSNISQGGCISSFFPPPNSSKTFYLLQTIAYYLDWWFHIMFLFYSTLSFGQYQPWGLSSWTRELRMDGHGLWGPWSSTLGKMWWSESVRGGSLLLMTILGHYCGDKGWSGRTSSTFLLSWHY